MLLPLRPSPLLGLELVRCKSVGFAQESLLLSGPVNHLPSVFRLCDIPGGRGPFC